ncbi:porin [Corynebacterium hiratae]|uniref:Porin n=1 Tax=Corynebacterium aurimucosum TaxID=169292 RepID=A0A6I3KBV2_9CORY|nr:porin [Corynebacterium aurimucosum]MTD91829.1 porin [Corynebacterium aurimucosum]
MGTFSSTGILGDILSVLYALGDMASGAKKLIGLL